MWPWIINLWLSNTTWHHELLLQLIGSLSEAGFAEEKAFFLTALKFAGPFQKMFAHEMSDAGSISRSYGIQAWMQPYTAKERSPCQGARGVVDMGRGKGSSLPHPQQSRRWQCHVVTAKMISLAHHPHQDHGCLRVRRGCWQQLQR